MKKNMDQRIMDAEIVWDSLDHGSPKSESDWGFFSRGDDAPVAGQSIGQFTWLRSRPECLNFIRGNCSPPAKMNDPQENT